jgi:co-chaperonin GroES (HSP10)
MLFTPMNKLLLVEEAGVKKTKTVGTFILPEEALKSRYSVVRLLRASEDCVQDFVAGDLLVVQTALIDLVEFEGEKFRVLTENAVVGRLQENEL